MSVEIKEINKSGGFRAEWDNICRLYRLQLVQKKLIPFGFLLYLLVSAAVISLFSQFSLIWALDDTDYIRGIGGMIWLYILILILGIASSDYNILSAENISIYPGTVRTRFISRLLVDYTMFSAIIICSIICRILGAGITNLIIFLTGNDGIHAFFDLRTLLFRAIACLCYILMMHSIYILFYVISTKIGTKKTVITLVALCIAAGFMLKFTPLFQWIIRFAKIYVRTDLGLANVALRTLSTTCVILIISFAVMSTIHAWKDHNQKELRAFSIMFSYALALAISIGGSILLTETSYSITFPEENLEEMIQNKELISHDYKIQAGIVDGKLLEKSCTENDEDFTSISGMNTNIAWMNLERAIKLGMVPKNATLSDGEMLVRVVASNYKHHGEYLYKNFIDSINFNIADGKCVMNIDKNITIYDDFLSVVDAILGDEVENMDNFGEEYFTMENCQIYVIFNKGNVKKPNKLESMYGQYVE